MEWSELKDRTPEFNFSVFTPDGGAAGTKQSRDGHADSGEPKADGEGGVVRAFAVIGLEATCAGGGKVFEPLGRGVV